MGSGMCVPMGGGCVMCVPMKCGGRWLCDVCAYEVWWEVVVWAV